ncbi:MAG: L,D-transpeptidase [Phycisphaerae bacterium]|nr:L,D-transpeptidase [Phycisphaerae bacterium]
MARKYHNRKDRSWMIYVAIAVIAAVATWQFWPDERAAGPTGPGPIPPGGNPTTRPSPGNVIRINRTVRTNNTATRPDAKSSPAALKKFNAGNAAFKAQKHLEARRLLSEAVFAGGLAGKLAEEARAKLSYLAEGTLFARTIDPRDPYTMRYKFKTGDLPATVERQQRLHVPSQLLVKVNGLPNASKFQAGVDYKLIKGPFHAVVYKSIFKMDLYLYRNEDNLAPVFIKRYEVGLGKNNSTPVGLWRLGCGALADASGKPERGKLLKAAWNPPPNSTQKLRIEYSMPGYPFGRKGMWISLVGLDENTKKLTDYGIHSTDDQSSIGKQASMGCIRMRDADIQEVYDRLYEKWSTVRILP